MRDALAWATGNEEKAKEPSENPWVWFWEAIQGDFNEDRSVKQITVDAAISIIPFVDQICDVRDLIANCKKLYHDLTDVWAWVALALTLIGLFPALGSVVKGVLKIFFLFVRRLGRNAVVKAVDQAMTWVIAFLRRRDVQKYLRLAKFDEVFTNLVTEIKAVRGRVNVKALIEAFDTGIYVMEALVNKVSYIPAIGTKAKDCLAQVKKVRLVADAHLAEALKPVMDVVDTIVMRLEREALQHQHGIVNANNIHFRGTLPTATAVRLMSMEEPLPSWLSRGNKKEWKSAEYNDLRDEVDKAVKDGWPNLNQQSVESFHTLERIEIKGPARLFRVLSPNSRAMSDCWITREIYERLQNSPDPRAAWRKNLAVWPDWNANGQFVIYDIKPGETLKAWRGPTSSQTRMSTLPDRHLAGGWEQLVFNVSRTDATNDAMRYYKLKGGRGNKLESAISQAEYETLSKERKSEYTGIREKINHPSISGPFETGWGYTDFGGQGHLDKIGLPSLPGQTTALAK